MDRIDAGLTIDEEGTAGQRVHARLCQSPRLGARDVVDLLRGKASSRCNKHVVVVEHDEGQAVPREQAGWPV